MRVRVKRVFAGLVGVIMGLGVLFPAAANDDNAAVRSFPAQNRAGRADVIAESVSADTGGGTWGGIERLSIPKTGSPARRKAGEQAEQREREMAARAQARSFHPQTASRSQARQPLPKPAPTPQPVSTTGLNPATLALRYAGKAPYVWGGTSPSGWDCSGMVLWVYRQFGVSLPHYSGAQARVGQGIPDLGSARPGDIIANSQHAGIYLGNGMVVSALNTRMGTQATPIGMAFHGGYAIRRIL